MLLKRPLALLLVCSMVFVLALTGCNEPADTTDGTTTTSSATSTTSTTSTTATTGDATTDTSATDGTTDTSASDSTSGSVSTDTSASDGSTANSTTGTTATAPQGGVTAPTTESTKPVSTTASTTSNVREEPLLPSFTRNADGTCTDRETGVVFFDDECDGRYYSATNIAIDRSSKEFFGNDGARYIRADGHSNNWSFTYYLPSGIFDAHISAFTTLHSSGTYVVNGFEVYVSANGREWEKVKLQYKASLDTNIGSGWLLRNYTVKDFGTDKKFLRVSYVPIDGCAFFTPNISRVRINNVDKMNEPDRFLEGRVSRDFYVDPAGNDNNDGLTPQTAWKSLQKVNSHYYQPGDKILFKSGASFTGQLKLNGYGTATDRLTITTYGGDKRAKIVGRGSLDNVVNVAAEYFTLENLEVTGEGAGVGILVGTAHTGANKGILVQNCYVHDIYVDNGAFGYSTGGIQLNATGLEPTWFEGAVVRSNIVENVSRVGIYMTGAWGDRPGASWGASGPLYKSDTNGWWPNKNCSITGNTVIRAHGDAILVISADKPLIERNFVSEAFCIPANKINAISGNIAAVAIWVCNTNDAVMQFNEVGYTYMRPYFNDAEAFDIDGATKNTTVQYNYSHHNAGGFLLRCWFGQAFTQDSVDTIRFNLSFEDGRCGIMAVGNPGAVNVYNNTFIGKGTPFMSAFGSASNYTVQNNIIYGGALLGGGGSCTNVVFDNNVYYNATLPEDRAGVTLKKSKKADPKFKNAAFSNPMQETPLRNEAIAAFSPQTKITGATNIKDNGGKDIAGNTFTTLDFYGCIKH